LPGALRKGDGAATSSDLEPEAFVDEDEEPAHWNDLLDDLSRRAELDIVLEASHRGPPELERPPVDARGPASIRERRGVHMMHSSRVPAGAAPGEQGTARNL